MTTRIHFQLLATLAAACYLYLPAQAFAQGPGAAAPGSVGFTLQFDENGNSLLNGGPNPNLVQPIVNGGIDFYLPVPVVPGFVVVQSSVDVDPLNISGDSDLLTFSNVVLVSGQTVGVMNYQSLLDPFDPVQLADVSSLNYLNPFVTIPENGPEGNNGFTWIPDPPNAAGAVYIGISDGSLVPEPGTIALLGMGGFGLGLSAYKRRNVRCAHPPQASVVLG